MTIPRLVITPGEPAGIGPDVVIQIAQKAWDAELIVIADPELLMARAKQLKRPLTLTEATLEAAPSTHQPGTLKIIPITLFAPTIVGELEAENAAYVLSTLQKAAELCLQKKVDAVVTGPVHKEVMQKAGLSFLGHTEFFASLANVAQTVMLFVVDQLKVALVTTHLPLKDVPHAITQQRLQRILTLLHDELQQKFHLANPRIAVCGLNPHAGEGGYLGREEIDIIIPTLNELRQKNYLIDGPLPADTIFTPAHLANVDVVLGMYHDQVLPVVKHMGFDHAVNVTLGLPFIRTSVDHGTALDLAGTGNANAGSMEAAIALAIKLV